MTDSPPETNPSLSAAIAEGNAAKASGDTEKTQLAFIRRRLPTVVEFADNVHREDYEVPAEDRGTLARTGYDLEYALDKAELYRSEFTRVYDMYHEVLRTQREDVPVAAADDVVGEAEFYINEDDAPRSWSSAPVGAGPEWYLRRLRYWVLASAFLFVGHLVLLVLGRVG